VPKSWQSAKKRLAREGKIRPAVKPDIDNLVKAILDALNGGIAYEDDKQIVELTAVKLYGDPRTEIMLEELN
jgi:Holliday junction resolvase RusA-like endonuclease